jgi:hypothetical protein
MKDQPRPGPCLVRTYHCTGYQHLIHVSVTAGGQWHCTMLGVDVGEQPVTPQTCPYRPDSTAPAQMQAVAAEMMGRWIGSELQIMDSCPL